MKFQLIIFQVFITITILSYSTLIFAQEEDFEVVVHALDDPRQLNPMNAVDGQATTILYSICQSLLNIDSKTGEMIPILAKEIPEIKEVNGMISLAMEIRSEARWDNGTSITGEDIAFNIKLLKIRNIHNAPRRNYFDFIQDVEIDKKNPRKFKLICKPYFGVINSLGDLHIIPSYVYDPKGVLKNYTIAELIKNEKTQETDEALSDYADFFNSNKFQREFVGGSGPYELVEWEIKQRIVLKLKKDWWGHQLSAENHWFEAYPNQITFERINDLSTATVALKSGEIDVMNSILPKVFVTDLQKSKAFMSRFNLHTPPQYAYDYIGINMKNPKLEDIRTRQALRYLMDVQAAIDQACYGLGEQATTFIHPTITKRLNSNIKAYQLNIKKAKALLKAAGWKDKDKDGVLEKRINGKKEKLILSLYTNIGNKRRETIAEVFKKEAEKAGVEINIEIFRWHHFRQKLDKRDYELYIGGWASSPLESDPKQIWHSESINGGSNYAGFNNAEADKVIEEIRTSMDENVRNEGYKKLQQIIDDEVPYIFVMVQKQRVAVSKQFTNVIISGIRPNYWVAGFKRKK